MTIFDPMGASYAKHPLACDISPLIERVGRVELGSGRRTSAERGQTRQSSVSGSKLGRLGFHPPGTTSPTMDLEDAARYTQEVDN